MNKEKLITKIDEIINFLIDGEVRFGDEIYKGHPCFFINHSKAEMQRLINETIVDKEEYNRYDLYYYLSYIIKYMLYPYDCHTFTIFTDWKVLPVIVRIINGTPYIVACNEKFEYLKGQEIKKINGVDIKVILAELEKITCYASLNHLKFLLEDSLTNVNILKSLPSLVKGNTITIETTDNKVTFDLNNLDVYKDKTMKNNYDLQIIDDMAIITYKACNHEEQMKQLIEKLKDLNVNKYIVDLRGNKGGNSAINRYLIEFLKGKDIIALSDERVFSSASFCLSDLRNIGAKIIGTSPGTSINCFGNCLLQKEISDMHLKVYGSTTYYGYNENLEWYGLRKEDFAEALQKNPSLLKPIFIDVDEKVELSLDDYLMGNDSVIAQAIGELNENKNKL